MKRINRWGLFLCLALAVAAMTALPASAAQKSKLIKEVKYKNYVMKSGRWKPYDASVKYQVDVIKYNKKHDPVKITTKNYMKSGKVKTRVTSKFKYTYKKGKKATRKEGKDKTTYNKGIPVYRSINHGDGYGRSYKYTFNSRYASKVVFWDWDPNSEDDDSITMNFKIKMKKGLPVSITGKAPGGFPVTITFYKSGVKQGLVKKLSYDGSRQWDEKEIDKQVYTYTYKVKKGKVISAVRKCTSYSGYSSDKSSMKTSVYKTEFNFTYIKTKTNKKRFAAMINDIVANHETNDSYGRPVLYTYWY